MIQNQRNYIQMKMMAETKLVTYREEVNIILFYTILLFDRNYCFQINCVQHPLVLFLVKIPLIETVTSSRAKPKTLDAAICQTAHKFATNYLNSQKISEKKDIKWIKGIYEMPSTIQFFQQPSSAVKKTVFILFILNK